MAASDLSIYGANDLTRQDWSARLAGTPIAAEADPGVYYDLVATYGLSHAFILAVGVKEHNLGRATTGIQHDYHTKSWGNARSVILPASHGQIVVTPKGPYATFPTWRAGLDDLCYRLTAPNYVYRLNNATTVETVLPLFAPASDGNDPAAYAAQVLAWMAQWRAAEGPKVRLALTAGHHNAQGGDAEEIKETGLLTPAIAAAARRQGWDVRVYTPDDGRGTSPDGLDTIAARVTADAQAGWVPDVYLETHSEAGPRGVFCVYPDAPGDVDADVRDTLGPDIARRIAQATGLPLRFPNGGAMSEQSTAVGESGSRLGIFRVTEPIKATTTRLILECGSHTDAADLALMAQPGYYDAAAGAVCAAIAAWKGLAIQSVPTAEEDRNRQAVLAWVKARPELGDVIREGVLDLGYIGGSAVERVAATRKGVAHTFKGAVVLAELAAAEKLARPDLTPSPYTLEQLVLEKRLSWYG
ncbi:MAG TPA: hypothetical protein VFL91_08515 [Thermomicrobiales bacterium]|nr:hypothetical protein [Thermomicrobiales bacterium]